MNRNVIRRNIEDKVAEIIVENYDKQLSEIEVNVKDSKITFDIK